jgi:tRNA threonylcarbamoyl adenosine modification protein YeaZ
VLQRPTTLAIDTSSLITGVALAGDGLLELQRFAPPAQAGQALAPAIGGMLARQGLRAGDLELIVIASGPGSFTGLRIGLSTAKGLAFGCGAALAAVSTLEVLAWQAPRREGLVVPVIAARKGEVHCGRWRRRGPALLREGLPERLSVAELLAGLPDDALLIGPAVEDLRPLALHEERHLDLAEAPCNGLSLEWLLELGRQRYLHDGGDDPASLEPDYQQAFEPTAARGRL